MENYQEKCVTEVDWKSLPKRFHQLTVALLCCSSVLSNLEFCCAARSETTCGKRSAQRRIRHAEARPHVLGKQFDGAAVRDWIGLGQIPHGFDQQALTVDIAGIRSALTSLSVHLGWNRDREDFGHENRMLAQWNLSVVFAEEFVHSQYNAPCPVFQLLSSFLAPAV